MSGRAVLALLLVLAIGAAPVGSLSLQPGMPNVCSYTEQRQVPALKPCVKTFTHVVRIVMPSCQNGTGPNCGKQQQTEPQEVRKTEYGGDYQTETRVVHRCCPGWTRHGSDTPGCLTPTCPDGKDCLVAGRCRVENGGCEQQCNESPFFHCSCRIGYRLQEDGTSCRDVDECVEDSDGCSHSCTNTVGSFRCHCHSGYHLGEDGRSCYTIGLETPGGCADPNNPRGGCHHHCHNLGGSKTRCSCRSGYQLAADNRTCVKLANDVKNQRTMEWLADSRSKETISGKELVFGESKTVTVIHHHYHHHGENGNQRGRRRLHAKQLGSGVDELLATVTCPDGFFGPNCRYSCTDCIINGGRCKKNQRGCVCSRGKTGAACQDVCPAGFYGKKCHKRCNCPKHKTCDPRNGKCVPLPKDVITIAMLKATPHSDPSNETVHDAWSALLNRPQRGNASTEPEDGCPVGFYGENCNSACPKLCPKGRCHKIYGFCECEPGLFGKYCHLPCPDNTWGGNCLRECDCIDENSNGCDPKTGKCLCLAGYQGQNCEIHVIRDDVNSEPENNT